MLDRTVCICMQYFHCIGFVRVPSWLIQCLTTSSRNSGCILIVIVIPMDRNSSINKVDKLLKVFLLVCWCNCRTFTCRNHSVLVSTIFIGNLQKEVIATWILALAIISGILIFFFIVIGLIKVSTGCSKTQISF